MAVASLVMEAAADGDGEIPEDFEDLVIAGLLHDVVEDCGGPPRLRDVRARFGDRVGDIVEHCTDAMPAAGEQKPPWPERKRAYLASLEHKDDYRALLVTAADKLHNTRAIVTDLRRYQREGWPQEDFWVRFVADKPDTDLERRVPEILWYYQALADVISRKAEAEAEVAPSARLGRLAADLQGVVQEILGFAGDAGFSLRAPLS
ncbi:HD domain-containing protein [Thioalkalivibrio sp. XN279]|nr:HD domain-containing protein [Thioalkalivibrio sp. XN279]